MDYSNLRVVDLKALTRERGLLGYSRLKKAELIAFLQPCTRPPPIPALRSPPAMCTRPPRSTRPPPPPPLQAIAAQAQLVRFRPDRPRQPKLLRQLNSQLLKPSPALKPYQLKPTRGKETFIEPPMEQKESPLTNPKQLKRMKKKLDELKTKIRHSRKKHDGLIHKRNSLRKAIEELKWGNAKQPTIETAQGFVECE